MTIVRFGLLGVVEAHLGAEPIDLGHARQRWVLAALLADANRPVPIDRLTERVWGERPPYRARRLLASYVSRLRRILAAVGGVDLRHGPGGYLVSVSPTAVDVFRFRELIGAGTHGTATDTVRRGARAVARRPRRRAGHAMGRRVSPDSGHRAARGAAGPHRPRAGTR